MNGRLPYDRGLMLIVLCLLVFGVSMVFSTSSVASGNTGVFTRHLVFLVVGLGVMCLTMSIDYHFYLRGPVVFALLILTLLLLVGALYSPPVNNVNRWVSLGGFRGQPSELAKLTLVLFSAHFLMKRHPKLSTFKGGLVFYLAVLAPLVGLILIEPDLGTAACLVLLAGWMLYLGGLHWRYYACALLVAVPAFYFLVYRVPYRYHRILAFLNPEESPLGIGYQIRQSLIAVASGGLNGLGFAQGRQKLAFLPEPQTDFVFAIVGEELGLLGCLTLIVLFLLLFWRGVRIALRADSLGGTFVGLGIVGMIVFQALINMGVVLSLLPTKGIPLPFISVGGSSLLVSLAGIGILLNISCHEQRRSQDTSSSQRV